MPELSSGSVGLYGGGAKVNQIIRWLMQGIAGPQTKEEKRFVAEHPLQIPTDDEALRRAIEILGSWQDEVGAE